MSDSDYEYPLIDETTIQIAITDELKSLERQKEDWITVCGYIKNIITEYDHTKDKTLQIIIDIDNILDDAFGHMPTAIEKINSNGIK